MPGCTDERSVAAHRGAVPVSDAQKQRMQLRIGQQLEYLGDQRDCYEFYHIEHDVSLLATNEKLPLVRTCGEMQSMHGIYGYSLDGREDGETDFEEECLAAGELSHEHHCVDIDYCIDSKCGDHGKCVDDLLHYTCVCDKGFKVAMMDGSKETCEQVDERTTLGGHDRCGGDEWGACEDSTLEYSCKCGSGYQNQVADGGLDSCLPRPCREPEQVCSAVSKNGSKWSTRMSWGTAA